MVWHFLSHEGILLMILEDCVGSRNLKGRKIIHLLVDLMGDRNYWRI